MLCKIRAPCVIYLIPPPQTKCDIRSIFKWSTTGLNSVFSFTWTGCHIKVKKPSLPYCLPIAGGKIVGCIPVRRVLVLYKMQTALFRI